MIAPRSLIVEAALGPEVTISTKNGAPGIGRFISGPNSIVLNGQPFPPGVPNGAQPAPKP